MSRSREPLLTCAKAELARSGSAKYRHFRLRGAGDSSGEQVKFQEHEVRAYVFELVLGWRKEQKQEESQLVELMVAGTLQAMS